MGGAGVVLPESHHQHHQQPGQHHAGKEVQHPVEPVPEAVVVQTVVVPVVYEVGDVDDCRAHDDGRHDVPESGVELFAESEAAVGGHAGVAEHGEEDGEGDVGGGPGGHQEVSV